MKKIILNSDQYLHFSIFLDAIFEKIFVECFCEILFQVCCATFDWLQLITRFNLYTQHWSKFE